ncbi:SfnB family sulfur acquisition oxidoreductase [Acinetobacter sp. MD2]|uniref:SfnB family sulfur acquisition oxidoreductase n=1 Tax=Acinetobacter sp. MD2 TaxID=2600066 RepID=UPI002D1F3B4B|nr:SfnB family sulfur acquisition oxidoreductase [Acinetobacter sp. MD2]MEB3767635.1 SfnB family sulfur acquisition oxidoreductase [Acinetobacter sp. MD2]
MPTNKSPIQNDQTALNAAYQLADLALEQRNLRDQKRILPHEIIKTLVEKGLAAIRVPKQYGGAYVSNQTLAQIFRILAKADANIGQIPQNGFGVQNIIRLVGSEQQKEFVFSEILKGKFIANGGPERNSQDTKSIHTRLDIENNQYFVTGEKFYSTGSQFADWLAIKAQHPEGYLVLVLIDRHAKGVTVVDDWHGFGQRTTSSGSVKLERVNVNPLLIFDERGLTAQNSARGAYSQLLQVAIDVGIAEAAFQDTLSTIRKARPIADANVERASQEPYTLQEVGKLDVLLSAAILLLDDAAAYLDELESANHISDAQIAEASIKVAEAKIYAHHAALTISEKLFELGGSRSSLSQHNLDQHWRNARVHTLHDPVRWKYFALGNYYLNGVHPARHAWI